MTSLVSQLRRFLLPLICLPVSGAASIMIGGYGSGAMFGAPYRFWDLYFILVSGVFFQSGQSLPFYRYRISHYNYWFDLIPVAIGNMGNNVDKPTGQNSSLLLSVLIILVVNIFTKGFIKSISIFDWFDCWYCYRSKHELGWLLTSSCGTYCPRANAILPRVPSLSCHHHYDVYYRYCVYGWINWGLLDLLWYHQRATR